MKDARQKEQFRSSWKSLGEKRRAWSLATAIGPVRRVGRGEVGGWGLPTCERDGGMRKTWTLAASLLAGG